MSERSHSLSQRKHPYLPGIWLAAGFLGLASLGFLLRPVGVTPNSVLESAAKSRLEKLSKLREEQDKALNSYGWIDKEKGIAHIPLDKAVQIILPKLRANDPHAAYAIALITPSAITAAGAPLYPEVPMQADAIPLALAADGGKATNAVNSPAPKISTNSPVKKP